MYAAGILYQQFVPEVWIFAVPQADIGIYMSVLMAILPTGLPAIVSSTVLKPTEICNGTMFWGRPES